MTKLVQIECGTCGVVHAIPEAMYDAKHKEGGFWQCPNGHSRGFSRGSLQKENERLKQDAARLEQIAAEQRRLREKAEKQLKKTAKKLMNVEKRAHAGVCPCCNRTFSNVQRHMETKHPEQTAHPENIVPFQKKSPA